MLILIIRNNTVGNENEAEQTYQYAPKITISAVSPKYLQKLMCYFIMHAI